MNLWEDTYERCHPNSDPSVPPKFSTNWPTGFELSAEQIVVDTFAQSQHFDEEPLEPNSDFEIQDEQTIGENSSKEAKDALSKVGIDAIALYAPVHFFGKSNWGIYIHERRFYGLCWSVYNVLDKPDWNLLVHDVYKALMQHEYLHSSVELFSLVYEDFASFLGQPCAFDEYFRREYQPSYPTDQCLEERIATAAEFRTRYQTRGFYGAISQLNSALPDAYSKWRDFQDKLSFNAGFEALALKIRETGEGLSNHASPDEVVFYPPRLLYSNINPGRIGRLWVPPLTPAALDELGPVPSWVYRSGGVTSRRTLKKSFPRLKMKKLIKFLESEFEVTVQSGAKHQKLIFPNGNVVHCSYGADEVKIYLIKQVAVALGMEKQELMKSITEFN